MGCYKYGGPWVHLNPVCPPSTLVFLIPSKDFVLDRQPTMLYLTLRLSSSFSMYVPPSVPASLLPTHPQFPGLGVLHQRQPGRLRRMPPLLPRLLRPHHPVATTTHLASGLGRLCLSLVTVGVRPRGQLHRPV